jgi:glycine/D-amino acid oxidase-like deaminating enzyme
VAAHRSLWLAPILEREQLLPALQGSERADVAIVGGGFVGLWTALELKRRAPETDVVVVERDVCGGGASGRNGGFVLSWWGKLPTLVKRFGEPDAVAIARQCGAVTEEIGDWCTANAPDADHRPNGWLWTATAAAHVGAWNGAVELADRVAPGVFERLSDEEIAARTGSSVHLAGVLDRSAATVDPGALSRALARAARQAGVRIYEQSEVVRFERGDPVTLATDKGSVTAPKAVIATNAWAANLKELRNALVVVSSDIVATPAIGDRLQEIGWTGGEAITNSQLMVNYYRTTKDGRIAFGKGGWGIAFGGHITSRFDRDPHRAHAVANAFRATYPALADVPIAADWSGPIDRSADGLPLIGHLGGRRNVVYAVGWSGNGVGPSLLGAKTVASLALESDDDWARSPLVDRRTNRLPPEPIRYIGAHVVREAVRRKEAAELAGRRPRALARALARLVPAGLEDH